MKIRTTNESTVEPGPPHRPMTMNQLREFVEATADVPGDAHPAPVTRDIGNQRDPELIVIAMRVTWETER